MLLECRICKYQVHDSRSWEPGVWVTLLWWSGIALGPVILAREDARYLWLPIVLFPIVLLGVSLWLLRLAFVALCQAITYLRFVGWKCPSCGHRKWTWPVLDHEDTVM